MNAEQQRRERSHGPGGTDGTRAVGAGQQQTFTALDPQRALADQLMEQVCDPKNLIRAYRRVRANKGKPGVDGMTVHELADWLRQNHVALTASLLGGTYQPQPVRGVQIPKPGGGQRQLGIPTVSANCTRAQFAFGMGGDPPSVPSASRPALPGFEGASNRRY
jgi:RNA-directed DNA polymerase